VCPVREEPLHHGQVSSAAGHQKTLTHVQSAVG
jgi:hypothetical protein